MPSVNRSALVMFSAQQMYQLINDVANYPQFVPNCADANVVSHQQGEMVASLLIKKAGTSQWFTTRNSLETDRIVKMELVDGPFKHLTGAWQLTPLDVDACKVELEVNFEFSSKMIELAFGKVFNQVVNQMVEAFTSRAKDVY